MNQSTNDDPNKPKSTDTSTGSDVLGLKKFLPQYNNSQTSTGTRSAAQALTAAQLEAKVSDKRNALEQQESQSARARGESTASLSLSAAMHT